MFQQSSPRITCWLLLVILLAVLPQTSSAQLYHLETILEADGLPSPDIKSITQDRWGVVWVATRGGIAFHNGITWEKANLDNLTSFTSDGLLGIDPQGNVWALMSSNDPVLLRNNFCNWESVPLPAGLSKSHQEFSHLALNATNNRTVAAIANRSNQLHISLNEGWYKVPLGEIGITEITDLISMDSRFILAAPEGLFAISCAEPEAITPLLDDPLPSPVKCMSLNPVDNSLWIVGDDWIAKMNNGPLEYLVKPQNGVYPCFSDSQTKTCQTDGFGGIYLSGILSTQYFHPETGMVTRGPKNGFLEYGTVDFFLDRERVLWQGTVQGIHKVLSRHSTGYNKEYGLLSDEVTALLYRHDGTMVLGHNNGLTFWNDHMTTLTFPDYDLRDRALDLAEDSLHNIWIAGRQKGLGRLSDDGSFKWWRPEEKNIKIVTSVLVDEDDRVWVSASDQLLFLEKGNLTEFPLKPHVESGVYLRRLIKGRDGTIFIATGNRGLLGIKGDQFQQWTTGLNDHGNSVFDVLEMDNGVIWVGTKAGLYLLDAGRLVRPSEPYLIIERPVYSLEVDFQNRLWLGTDNGVIRIDGDQIKHLTVEDGLIGRETNRSASLVDPSGKFWVGTDRGLTVFDDLFENTNILPPLVYLISLEADGKRYPLISGISDFTLPTQAASLHFNYRVFTTTEAKRMKVLYKLDGLDEHWVERNSAGEQIIRYTHVPPGTYQFHVKAAGFGQPWSEVASSPTITLPVPFWQHRWFQFLAGLALLAILILPVIFIFQRRYTIRLQKEVKEQVAANLLIETELEQARNLKALGLLAGGIAHDFNNLLTIILGNLSLLQGDDNLEPVQKKRLGTATGAIERARGLTNQLLTFSKGGAPILKVGSLAGLVRESSSFVLQGSNTKCQFELPENLWSVVMDSGQMSQVVNNLLMNAQEAMPSGGIVVLTGRNLEQAPIGLSDGIYVEITVSDNGPGISPVDLPKIFDPYFSTKEKGSGLGLATAFSIVERHNGRLSVQSTLGQGTTFQMLIPASSALPEKDTNLIPGSGGTIKGTVLVLDDDTEVRQSLGLMLERLGMQVENAAEGNQALKLYEEMLKQGRAPDIVLMDLTIPGGLGGLDIIGPLLEMDSKAKAIVISGYSHNPVISQHKQYGFKAAIAKPIMINELGNVLTMVLAD